RLAQQFQVAIHHPIPKKAIWRLQRRCTILDSEKRERSDPGFVTHLPKRSPQTLGRLVPYAFHQCPPPRAEFPPILMAAPKHGRDIELLTVLSTGVDKLIFCRYLRCMDRLCPTPINSAAC